MLKSKFKSVSNYYLKEQHTMDMFNYHVIIIANMICLFCHSYRMRIEGLLIKEEFNTHMEWIRPAIEAIIQAAGGRCLTLETQYYNLIAHKFLC